MTDAQTADFPRVRTELPGPRSAALMARNDAIMYGPYREHSTVPLYIDHKTDWLIGDVDGNTYVDHVSGWGSNPLGAQPQPALDQTIAAMHRYGFEITDYVRSPPPIELAERLVELAPASITRAASGITGTEVVEGAVKLAREATGRPMILGFLGQYHGESTYLTAAGSTDLSEVTSNSAQYVSGLVFAPYPNRFRAPFHKGPGPYDDTHLRRLPRGGALAPPGRPRAGRGGADRAGARRGRDRDPVGRLLGAAGRPLRALRLGADR